MKGSCCGRAGVFLARSLSESFSRWTEDDATTERKISNDDAFILQLLVPLHPVAAAASASLTPAPPASLVPSVLWH